MDGFVATASTFERYRALPGGVPEAIRSAILAFSPAPSPPNVLDIGAGTGRIGRAFVAAGDSYVGVDLSLEMLRQFTPPSGTLGVRVARLVQADGEQLPFRDATFDVGLFTQVLSGARHWRRLLIEALRVLRVQGALVVGHTELPQTGIDARLKTRLHAILDQLRVEPPQPKQGRKEQLSWLESVARRRASVVAASWRAGRTPREFMARHRTGARFSVLPPAIQQEALRELGAWVEAEFGSLDSTFTEVHSFILDMFEF
jgi:ubiquinone/menaquinone biosynthesis C-methylase UbiE